MNKALKLLFLSVFLTGTILANEPIGQRAESHQEHLKQQEKRCRKAQESEENTYVKKGFKTTHDGIYHNPIWVSPLGDQVELDDSTLWSIAFSDRKKTFNWCVEDTIIITPDNSWFSSYHYKLRNLTLGVSVRANILDAKLNTVLRTYFIAQLDRHNGELCLEDGSVWSVAGWDSSVIRNWYAGDRIVMGCNDGWFSGSNPNILINLETLNYAAARCVY